MHFAASIFWGFKTAFLAIERNAFLRDSAAGTLLLRALVCPLLTLFRFSFRLRFLLRQLLNVLIVVEGEVNHRGWFCGLGNAGRTVQIVSSDFEKITHETNDTYVMAFPLLLHCSPASIGRPICRPQFKRISAL